MIRKNAAWKPDRKLLVWSGVLPIVGLVLFMGSGASAGSSIGPGDIIGYMNRAAILAYMVWQIAVARLIMRKQAEGK